MAIRKTVVACWLFAAAIALGQSVEELRAKLQQADIDKAVMVERAHHDNPTSSVLIAFIGALPAMFAAWLTFEGNKMMKKNAETAQSNASKSTTRTEELATERTTQNQDLSRGVARLEKIAVDNADVASLQASQITAQLKDGKT